MCFFFFFSSRRRHTRYWRDWSSDVCSSDLLAAVRRRETFLTRPLYLSTFLREEGRLAALAGENDAAIEAYRHYLTLRAAPEPPLRSEVEYVRDELGKLERASMIKE